MSVRTIIAGATAAAAACVALFAPAAAAAPTIDSAARHTAESAASTPASIQWVGANGKVTRTWTGTRAEQAVIEKKYESTLPPRKAAGKPNSFPPAMTNISRHSPCTAGTGYFEVYNYPPLVCFANSGTASVYIDQVYKVNSGNNTGAVEYKSFGVDYVTRIGAKYRTVYFNNVLVITVKID